MSQEVQVKFLYGKFKDSNPAISPGTIYLDIGTGEMFYDDPTSTKQIHEKIIDTATLIYTIVGDSLAYPSSGSEDASIPGINDSIGSASAVLGVAVLGSMVLGKS